MIFVEPAKMKVRVLEEKKLKVSQLFSTMKKTANGFWKEKLTKVVKTHQKLLLEQDKLANEHKTLQDKKSRLDEDDAGSSKAKKIDKELAELETRKQELREEKAALWKLTPKSA